MWNGSTGSMENPQRRDTQMLRQGDQSPTGQTAGKSHLVVQFKTDNPGVWPLHCHRAWHVSSGLYINLLVRLVVTEVQTLMEFEGTDFCDFPYQ